MLGGSPILAEIRCIFAAEMPPRTQTVINLGTLAYLHPPTTTVAK